MSRRLRIYSDSRQEALARAKDAGQEDPHFTQLATLAQLVQELDHALLVVEHPQLAARVLAELRKRQAA